MTGDQFLDSIFLMFFLERISVTVNKHDDAVFRDAMLLLLQFSDPYVKVELFSANRRVAKKKTRVKKKTVNPKFAQTFTFDLGGKLALDHMTLMFTVLVQDSSGCHERIGQVVLSTAAGDGPEFDHWSQVICNPHCPIDQWHMIHE